jgi:hypothetical protein
MFRDTKSSDEAVATAPGFEPRTALGRRLWELRQQILAEGEPTLEWSDLERELAARRGECSAGD